jgi:hypothetical protein
MRAATFLAVASTALLLACSEPEAPAPAAVTSPAGMPPAAAPQKAPPVPAAPANPLPTVAEPPRGADVRRPDTPCDRNEPGWKWTGNVVEDGRCVVGPCDCVRG